MFKLHVFQAQFGDSLLLEYGAPGKPRYILIDGGPPGNYAADLQAALAQIPGDGGELDLLVLSHIDNDHIVGILDLLADIEDDLISERPLRLRIAKLWYNSFEQTLDRDGELTQELRSIMSMAGTANMAMPMTTDAFYGVREGNRLRLAAQKLKITQNSGFKDGLIAVETAPEPINFGPLELRIVGPSRAALGALRKKWIDWLVEASQAVASKPNTTAMIDRSVPNLSSIVLLASCDNRTMLLTGDARGDHILAGVKAAGLAEQGKLHVDVLKVPHHGSSRNTDEKFFRSLTADIYVISANGKYGNPDLETLQWIVAGDKQRTRAITLFVTNETETTRALRNQFDPKAYHYELKVLEPGAHRYVVTLSD